jgi:hypothetical protein
MPRRATRRTRSLFALAAVTLAATLALPACSQAPPSDPPGITGSVTSLVPGDGRPASMMVEGTQPQPQGAVSDRASVSIPPTTQFLDAKGEKATFDAIAGIAKGTRVRVWFEGAVAESYPVQGSAKVVQILGDLK